MDRDFVANAAIAKFVLTNKNVETSARSDRPGPQLHSAALQNFPGQPLVAESPASSDRRGVVGDQRPAFLGVS